jgi:hypothetical protein
VAIASTAAGVTIVALALERLLSAYKPEVVCCEQVRVISLRAKAVCVCMYADRWLDTIRTQALGFVSGADGVLWNLVPG